MLKALIGVRFAALRQSFFSKYGKNDGKRSPGMKVLIAFLFVYVIGALAFSVGATFIGVGPMLVEAGLNWLYFALIGVMCTLLCVFGSVFTASKQLFEAKDNELLLSMPIPPRFILLSRMIMLLVTEYIFSIIVVIPAGIVYCMIAPVTAVGVAVYIVCCLFLPLLGLALCCLIGWVISLISAHMARKNLIYTVLLFLFFGLYFYAMTNINNYITSLVANGESIGKAIKTALPMFYSFGCAITLGSGWGLHLALFLLWCALPFGIAYLLLSRSFLKITTTRKAVRAKKYQRSEMQTASADTALLKKELARLTSLPIYMFNCCIGSVMMLVLSVVAVIKSSAIVSAVAEFGIEGVGTDTLGVIIACALCFCALTNCSSAVALSIEGKNLWLLKSLPVSNMTVFKAKVLANIVSSYPFILVSASLCAIVFKPGLTGTLSLFLLPLSMQLFTALFGMCVNLRFPRFDWISETAAVKQSMSVLVALFGAMGVMFLPVILYAALFASLVPITVYALFCAACLLLLCLPCFYYLSHGGSKRYDAL